MPILYSQSPDDLFSPQKRPALFRVGTPAPSDLQLAVEAARLAYFRFENATDPDPRTQPPLLPQTPEPSPRSKLEASLGTLGFTEFTYINDPVPTLKDLLSRGGPLSMPLVSLQKLMGTGVTSSPGFNFLGPVGTAIHDLVDQAADRVWQALTDLPKADRLAGFTDTQAYVAFRPSDRLAVIAVRGSQANTANDVLLDGRFLQVRAEGWTGSLHHGFARGASVLWKEISKWLDAHDDKPVRLLICGHSLGAAIATLVAVRTHEKRIPTQLITIGSPRVGDREFATDFATKGVNATRVVDRIDVVTHIPPENVAFLDYVHVGKPLFINRKGEMRDLPTADNTVNEGSLHQLATQLLLGPGLTSILPEWLADHAPTNYLRGVFP